MKITTFKEPFEHIIINDFFDKNELEKIWNEIKFLKDSSGFDDVRNTEPAIDYANNEILASRTGVFLENFYVNHRQNSLIYKFTRKLYNIVSELPDIDILKEQIANTNVDATLVSIYKDQDYYKSHRDRCIISILIYLWEDNKKFTGGDLIFEKYNHTIIPQNNMCLIFQSCNKHEVSKIEKCVDEDVEFLRVVISTFLNVK